jgi:1-phosphatidylinositol-4-phosphate 5-kinase
VEGRGSVVSILFFLSFTTAEEETLMLAHSSQPMALTIDPLDSGENLYPQQSTRSNPSSSTDEADEDNFASHNSSSARSMSSLATTVSSHEDIKTVQQPPSSNAVRIHSFESDSSDVFYDAKSNSLRSSSLNVSELPQQQPQRYSPKEEEEEFCFDDRMTATPQKHSSQTNLPLPNGTALTTTTTEPSSGATCSSAASTITPSNNNNNHGTPTPAINTSHNNNNAFLKPGRRSIESSSRKSLESPTIGARQSPSSSSTSLPIINYQRSASSSSKTPKAPPQPVPQQQPRPSRNSISSQISIASSQRENLQRQSSHRTSFSFSRRKSIAQSNRVSSNSIHLDENSGDIERLREAIIAQRESKRRRREHMEDERVLVGTKVSEGHVNYVTAYNMLTGIRVSVSRCNAKVDHELVDADFKAKHKLAFDVGGNELTPSAKYDFKFKDYAPWVFRHLRSLFKLDPADYLMSLTSKYIVSELGSPGKSGSFFYFSRDYRFIIKTIHHSEHKMLRRILKDYYYHVKNNPNTLISQFYGLHRVKLSFGRKIHFIVMNNLFPPHRDIHRTYDLKGSSLGRFLPEPDTDDQTKSSRVYKDLNWLKHKEHLKLGPQKREDFIKQLEVDVALLKRLNIMDYSLLIGIHDLTKGNTERIRDSTLSVFEPGQQNQTKIKVAELRKALNAASPTALNNISDLVFDEYLKKDFKFYADSGGFQATNENNEPLNEIYYLGIIDCLTPYTFFKRVETFWKGLSHNRTAVSAVPAQEYGDRFFNFIKSVITKNNNNNEDETNYPTTLPMANREQPRQSIEPALPALAETDRENGGASTTTSNSQESVIRKRSPQTQNPSTTTTN